MKDADAKKPHDELSPKKPLDDVPAKKPVEDVAVSADMIDAGAQELNKFSTGQHPNHAVALAEIYKTMHAAKGAPKGK